MDKKKLFDNIISIAKVVTPAIVCERVYDKMFNHHFFSYKPLAFSLEDFPNLSSERHTFYSESKNLLVGYIYKDNKFENYKGLFIFCHGYGGGGHHCYLDLINAICSFGYVVFAYDATANDESQGHTMKGFTQGLLDADQAINYVEQLKEYKHLDKYLCGHSWGAYSASTVLGWHKNIKGLIAFSGFNAATAVFKSNGERYAGEQANDFMGYVDSQERLLFGDISLRTAVESFEESKAKIVIIHSEDDMTVPIEAGFTIYKKHFKNDKRFKFVKLLQHGHGTVYYTLEGKKYYEKIHKEFNKYVKSNKPSELEKEEFLKKLIDRNIYNNLVDVKALKKYIDFITK